MVAARRASARRHVLLVGPLASARGAALEPALEIPFTFVRSRARVPAGVAVGSVLRARVGDEQLERLPLAAEPKGPYVELMKAVDRRTGAPARSRSTSPGSASTPCGSCGGSSAPRPRGWKLDDALHRRLASARAAELVSVAVWARIDPDLDIQPDDRPERREQLNNEPAAP